MFLYMELVAEVTLKSSLSLELMVILLCKSIPHVATPIKMLFVNDNIHTYR